MKVKLFTIFIVVMTMIASFGAIADNIDSDCDCKSSNNLEEEISESSGKHQTGLMVPDDWWVDAPFNSFAQIGGLPSSFDWRDSMGSNSGYPNIRDQGACGSCWAFATIGVLEWNIARMENKVVDLSEQWLVSCNREGWGCGGGWYAFDYLDDNGRKDKCGGCGAVLEEDFPYTATTGHCSCPFAHKYYIDSWSYIGNSYNIPFVYQIKQAIMNYGPISVGVYVGPKFLDYDGGIFSSNEIPGPLEGQVNHAVVLVGWQNKGLSGYWILRNSWGSDWGENGYMKIRFGTSNIGYAASYIEYTPDSLYTPGTVDFGTAKPGQTVTTSFTVYNGGDTCDWYIRDVDIPDWGEWTITPNKGTIQKNGQQKIDVKLKVGSNLNNGGFRTRFWVRKENDFYDYSLIYMRLSVTKNRQLFMPFLFKLFENSPILKLFL